MTLALPLLFAVLGPVLGPVTPLAAVAPLVSELPAPELTTPDADTWQGWRTLTGAATGVALGAGVPLAVAGAGTGVLVYVYSQAFAGALLGIGPALFALGTVATVVGAAACLPPCGSIVATAGAIWGAQKEGRDPRAALVGGIPGMALGATSFALALVAAGIGIGGFTLIVPWLVVVTAAVLVGVSAPAVAFLGATLADGFWLGIKPRIAQVSGADGDDAAAGAMAY